MESGWARREVLTCWMFSLARVSRVTMAIGVGRLAGVLVLA
jgi:hypothetical protein